MSGWFGKGLILGLASGVLIGVASCNAPIGPRIIFWVGGGLLLVAAFGGISFDGGEA